MENYRLSLNLSGDDVFFSTMYRISTSERLYAGFDVHLTKIDDERAKLTLFNVMKSLRFNIPEVYSHYEEKEISKIFQNGDLLSQYLLSQIEVHLYEMGYRGRVTLECADGPLVFVNVVKSPLEHVIKIEKEV